MREKARFEESREGGGKGEWKGDMEGREEKERKGREGRGEWKKGTTTYLVYQREG